MTNNHATRDDLRLARAGLLRIAEAPAPALSVLVTQLGPVETWRMICAGELPAAIRTAVVARTADRTAAALQQQAHADLRSAEQVGARLVIPEDDEWPDASLIGLTMSSDPKLVAPLGLYVRGAPLPADTRNIVTIVGSRACTHYGQRVATEFSTELAAAGCVVVSGAAFGVDAAAHRGAMAAAGPPATMAVLACGIDRVYPMANREVIDAIADGGGVVLSEYPPGTTPARHRFLVRNRLIAAFGAVTVVVEAGRRSGSISTANAAGKIGRQVMAVPGPVTSAMSLGCHELLRQPGTGLAAAASDVLEALGLQDISMPDVGPPTRLDNLGPDAARMYEALSARGTRTVDELVDRAGIPGRQALAGLAELELLDLAHRTGARWRRTRPPTVSGDGRAPANRD